MNKTILVTGGAGFIGSHFIRHLFKSYPNYNIINLDSLTYAADSTALEGVALSERYRFVKGDVADLSVYYSLLETVEYVVHCAAETSIDASFNNVDRFIAANVEATEKLLGAVTKLSNIKCFMYVSTDEVYGPIAEGYAREGDTLKPTTPYAKTKATAERLVVEYRDNHNVPAIIVRPSNCFGANQHVEKFIPKVITHALNNFSVPIYGDGEHAREWLYIDDCVRALDVILHQGDVRAIYNVGSNNIVANVDLARKIIGLCHRSENLIEFVADRKVHDRRYAMDCSKIEALGFEIKSDFDFCLLRTIDYYLGVLAGK